MNTEQKAKAYDEALERAREWHNDPHITIGLKGNLEEIFPELKESEDVDKKIREEIIATIHLYYGKPLEDEAKEMIAWLEKQVEYKSPEEVLKIRQELYQSGYNDGYKHGCEDSKKQGEQKPSNKVESKFHEGDWVVCEAGELTSTLQITGIKNGCYWFHDDTYLPVVDEDCLHLWTIGDARDGDVLVASDGSLFIFAKLKDNSAYYHFSLCKNGSKEISDGKHAWETANSCYPATESQRDTLLKAMTDAGYEWDVEKKELRLLITNCDDFFKSENCEQKPAEWNQENIEELTEFENAMMHIGGSFFGENAGLDPNDTDTIKEQAELLLELAPKIEWSEEDEIKITSIIAFLKSPSLCAMGGNKGIIDANIKYLKSLKERYTWKPSDEQMKNLSRAVNGGSYRTSLLMELYQDLKKLKGNL